MIRILAEQVLLGDAHARQEASAQIYQKALLYYKNVNRILELVGPI